MRSKAIPTEFEEIKSSTDVVYLQAQIESYRIQIESIGEKLPGSSAVLAVLIDEAKDRIQELEQ